MRATASDNSHLDLTAQSSSAVFATGPPHLIQLLLERSHLIPQLGSSLIPPLKLPELTHQALILGSQLMLRGAPALLDLLKLGSQALDPFLEVSLSRYQMIIGLLLFQQLAPQTVCLTLLCWQVTLEGRCPLQLPCLILKLCAQGCLAVVRLYRELYELLLQGGALPLQVQQPAAQPLKQATHPPVVHDWGVYTRQQLGEDRGVLVDRVGGFALGQLAQNGGKALHKLVQQRLNSSVMDMSRGRVRSV
ncbi:MAG: hypothetical protein FRX49_02749 [Trebouxia sp. A1-2]|nr:MAG: hypothetical protein FRX49_02749 [Trebouxia sp. A1-2]